MPAAAADFFGPRNAGAIYGAIIVGWSIGGVLGPERGPERMWREQASEVGAGRCVGTDLIGVGFLGASSSTASGPIRSARRCSLGTRRRSGRHPEERSDAAA
jgi:hypothetical protein